MTAPVRPQTTDDDAEFRAWKRSRAASQRPKPVTTPDESEFRSWKARNRPATARPTTQPQRPAQAPTARRERPLPRIPREPGSVAASAGSALLRDRPKRGGAELAEPRGIAAGLRDVVQAVRNPIQTAKNMGRMIVEDARDAVFSPVVESEREAARRQTGVRARYGPGASRVERITEQTPGAITPERARLATINTAANVGFAGAPMLKLPVRAAANAALGAVNTPDDPLRGATVGAVLGEAVLQGGKGVAKGARAAAPVVRPAVESAKAAAQAAGARAQTAVDAAVARTKRASAGVEAGRRVPNEAEGAGTPAADQPQVTIRRMRVDEIVPDPERFQYKRDADAESGAGSELKDLTQFDEQLAGVISVWRDPNTGIVHPVNGHNRLALAKRTGHESVNVQELPAKTASEARAMGALANVAEGRGTALDAARFFRETGLTPDDLRTRVSFKGVIARQGTGLSKLASDVFQKVERGDLPEGHGAAIGAMLDSPEMQRVAVSALERTSQRLSESEVRELARQIRDAGSETATQETLFGNESTELPLYVEKAKLADGIRRRLAADRRLFGYVAREGRADDLARAGNKIDVENSRRIADESAQLEEVFSGLWTRSGPIATALNDAARRIANGEAKPRDAIASVYPSIRDAVQEALGRREGAGSGAPGIGNRGGELEARPDAFGRQAAELPPDGVEQGVRDSTDPSQGGMFDDPYTLTPDDLDLSTLRDGGVMLDPAGPQSGGGRPVGRGKQQRATDGERLELFAVLTPDGDVVEGRSWYEPMRRAEDAYLVEKSGPYFSGAAKLHAEGAKGFVTTSGRFVTGIEAARIAFGAGQLRKHTRIYKQLAEGEGVVPIKGFDTRLYQNMVTKVGGPKARAPKELDSPLKGEIKLSAESFPDAWRTHIEETGTPPNAGPYIVSRAYRSSTDVAGGEARVYDTDVFSETGRWENIETGQPSFVIEGYRLSDGTFITRADAQERFGDVEIGWEGRDKSGPLFDPTPDDAEFKAWKQQRATQPDLFGGDTPPDADPPQESLFGGDDANTVGARNLAAQENFARSELPRLRQILAFESDPKRRADVARQIADHERLLNRDKAITADELATRSAADGPDPEMGPTPEVLYSPAGQFNAMGAKIRSALGIKKSNAGELLALRKISQQLAEAVGVPVLQGRGNLKRMKAEGAFWQKDEVIRVRRLKKLDTVAHEVGHYLSKKYGVKHEIKTLGPGQRVAIKNELSKMGHDLYGSRRPNGGYKEEGVAQWVRFLVTDRARMAADAPNFTRYMMDVLEKEPALLGALNKAHDDWLRYQASPANAKLATMIERSPRSRFAGMTVDKVINQWFDDLAPIQRAVEALGIPGKLAEDAGTLARLTKGNAGRSRDMLEQGVINFSTRQRVTRGLRDTLREVGEQNRDAFTEYLVAEQVLTKTAQGIDTGFDVEAARTVSDAGRANPAFVKGAMEVWEFRSALLDYMADAGLMLPDEVSAIRKGNPTPTPFYRMFGPDEPKGGNPRGAALARSSAGVHRMIGSDRPIIDPLQSIVADAYSMVDRAHKHHAAATLIKMALNTEGGGHIAQILPEIPMEAKRINLARVRDQLVEAGWNPPEDPALLAALDNLTLEAFFEKGRAGPRELREQIIPVLLDGERKWVQITDAETWKAITALDVPELGMYGRIMSAPTRWLRVGATQANPDFALVNPFRDAFPAAIYSRGPTHLPGYHILHGLSHLVKTRLGKGDDLVARWAQEGGENAGMVGADMRLVQKEYQQTLLDLMGSKSTIIKDHIRHPLRSLKESFEVLENGTRVGEFAEVRKQAMQRGASEIDASIEGTAAARDVTLDFFRAGSTARVVNRFVPFFTAQMGDMAKMAREFNPALLNTAAGRKRYATLTARAAAYVTVPGVMLYLMQKDDPTYQEVPEYLKANAWVIVDKKNGPIPYTLGNGEKTRIWALPRPHLLGYVFGYLPEKFLQWIMENDPDALKEMGKQAWSMLTPPILPTLIGPIIENYANRQFFPPDVPVVPPSTQRLDPAEQVSPRTGETARLIGRAVNYSPAKIENAVQGYTGGLGTSALEGADYAVRKTREATGAPPLRTLPAKGSDPLDRIPVIRRFIAQTPGANSESARKVRTEFWVAEQKRRTWHRMMREGRMVEAGRYLDKHREQIMSVATTEDAGSPGELRQLYNEMNKVSQGRRNLGPLPEAVRDEADEKLQGFTRDMARQYRQRQNP